MTLTSHRETINIETATLWDMMIDKIEHPDKYVPGVSKVEILGKDGDGTERRMTLEDGKVIHEMISASESTMTVIFKLIDDPDHFGTIRNTIFETKGGTVLEYALDWTRHDGKDVPEEMRTNMSKMIAGSVAHAKELAEENGGIPS